MKRGFVVIELLIVMAIMTILASMLLPVFARAREKGRMSACTSNMRQLHEAITMYASDYDGVYPAQARSASVEVSFHQCGSGVDAWSGTSAPNWAKSIFPYVRNYQVFVCPSYITWIPEADRAVEPLSYIMNGKAAGQPQDAATDPAQTQLLFDWQFITSEAQVNPFPNNWGGYSVAWYWGWAGHSGCYNVLYQDGHVKAVNEGAFGSAIRESINPESGNPSGL